MKKLFIISAVLASVMGVTTASATEVDLSKATCAEVLDGIDGDTLVFLTGWTDGYMSAKTGDHTFDSGYVEELVKKILDGCKKNPKTPYTKFIEKTLIQ